MAKLQHYLVQLCFLLHTAICQLNTDICINSINVDGTGYKNHEDCDKFIQCRYDSTGIFFGEIRSCPFGTYWNMDLLTCVSVERTSCLYDKCGGQPDGLVYPAETNCRGYWQCVGDKSVPRCCPFGQTFVEANLRCEDIGENDTDCQDTCFTHKFHVPVSCDKFPVPGKPEKYKQEVQGWGWMELDCAPGTEFHESSCACLVIKSIGPVKRVCRPQLHLPFTVDHRDQSGVRHHVTNENVVVKDGVAIFNGVNSRLTIPRFTNIEHSETVVIKVTYSSNHTMHRGIARTLVANNGCGNVPSLMIAEDYANVYFVVGTDVTNFTFTYVNQLNELPKHANLKFTDGKLTGSNGVHSEVVPAPGYLKNVKCAIQIGLSDGFAPFEGSIDEITVYLCDPDE